MENKRATNLKDPLPDVYRATAKRYAWLLLNVPTPDALLNAENSKVSEWYPANVINQKVRKLRKPRLLCWPPARFAHDGDFARGAAYPFLTE